MSDIARDGAAPGAQVLAVTPSSPAAAAGLQAGMTITEVDGQPLNDYIDWQWLSSEPTLELTVAELGGLFLQRDLGEPWGIEFAEPVFDGVKTCVNDCSFCFMKMLPKGMRPALSLRDDDYRLSFLQGNFVTLTNLSDDDLRRIVSYRLSPLHVSLHAVEATVRRQLMGRNQARGLQALEQLLAAEIEIHAQIVLLPGVNDGDILQQTLDWTAQRPGISAVGIVPYGHTRFAKIQRGFSREQCQQLCRQIAPLAPRVQLADEFFLRSVDKNPLFQGQNRGQDAGSHEDGSSGEILHSCHSGQGLQLSDAEKSEIVDLAPSGKRDSHDSDCRRVFAVPPLAYYGDFPLLEDGIGMTRQFIENWPLWLQQLPADCLIVTGEAFAPVIRALLAQSAPGVTSATLAPEGDPDVCPEPAEPAVGSDPEPAPEPAVGSDPEPAPRALSAPRVVAIKNNFFGGNVSVAGLLTGTDVIEQLRQQLPFSDNLTAPSLDSRVSCLDSQPACPDSETPRSGSPFAHPTNPLVLLPPAMFNDDGLTLDNLTAQKIAEALGCRVELGFLEQ